MGFWGFGVLGFWGFGGYGKVLSIYLLSQYSSRNQIPTFSLLIISVFSVTLSLIATRRSVYPPSLLRLISCLSPPMLDEFTASTMQDMMAIAKMSLQSNIVVFLKNNQFKIVIENKNRANCFIKNQIYVSLIQLYNSTLLKKLLLSKLTTNKKSYIYLQLVLTCIQMVCQLQSALLQHGSFIL